MSSAQIGASAVSRRFVTLRVIAGFCWGIAGMSVLGGLVAAIVTVVSIRQAHDTPYAVVAAVLTCLGADLVAVFWAAMAEGIHVLLAIEENTRQTAIIVRSWTR